MTTSNGSAAMNAATSNKAISVLVAKVKTSGEEFNTAVHDAMVAICIHAQAYGDANAAARLVGAMPTTTRRALVVKHFAEYSPIRISSVVKGKDKSLKASLRKPDDNDYVPFDNDKLKANPWYDRPDAKKEVEFNQVFNTFENKAYAFVQQLLNAASGQVTVHEDGKEVKKNKVSVHDQERIKFLAAGIKAAIKAAKEAELTSTSTPEAQAATPLSNAA